MYCYFETRLHLCALAFFFLEFLLVGYLAFISSMCRTSFEMYEPPLWMIIPVVNYILVRFTIILLVLGEHVISILDEMRPALLGCQHNLKYGVSCPLPVTIPC